MASEEYQYVGQTFSVEVLHGCARCHLEHLNIKWLPITFPIEDPDGTKWTHFAMCPTNGQPILMRSIKQNGK